MTLVTGVLCGRMPSAQNSHGQWYRHCSDRMAAAAAAAATEAPAHHVSQTTRRPLCSFSAKINPEQLLPAVRWQRQEQRAALPVVLFFCTLIQTTMQRTVDAMGLLELLKANYEEGAKWMQS